MREITTPQGTIVVDESVDKTKVGDWIFHKGSKGDIYFKNTGKTNDFIHKIISIENNIAKSDKLQWDWLIYPYYFGIGILTWYPSNYILNYHKKN